MDELAEKENKSGDNMRSAMQGQSGRRGGEWSYRKSVSRDRGSCKCTCGVEGEKRAAMS